MHEKSTKMLCLDKVRCAKGDKEPVKIDAINFRITAFNILSKIQTQWSIHVSLKLRVDLK